MENLHLVEGKNRMTIPSDEKLNLIAQVRVAVAGKACYVHPWYLLKISTLLPSPHFYAGHFLTNCIFKKQHHDLFAIGAWKNNHTSIPHFKSQAHTFVLLSITFTRYNGTEEFISHTFMHPFFSLLFNSCWILPEMRDLGR